MNVGGRVSEVVEEWWGRYVQLSEFVPLAFSGLNSFSGSCIFMFIFLVITILTNAHCSDSICRHMLLDGQQFLNSAISCPRIAFTMNDRLSFLWLPS